MFITSSKLNELVTKIISIISVYENFPLWFVDRLHMLSRQKVLYRLRNGVSFICESHTLDCQFINEMFVDNQYNCIPGFQISPTDIVVDCGAHKGIFSVFAAKQAVRGQVISYEPSPKTYQYLLENLSINKIENVTHFNFAVGFQDGMTQFHVAEDPGCSRIVSSVEDSCQDQIDSIVTIEVPQIGFENIITRLERIDFLKMDIEGMEFPILMNCPKSSLQKIKRIALEYHPEAGKIDALINHLEEAGFRTNLWQERRIFYAWRQ